MKSNMKFKRALRKSRLVIKEAAIYVIAIALFIAGYICSDMYVTKEITDEQYQSCKEELHKIYTKGETNLIDIPGDMYFDRHQMSIGYHGHFGYAQSTVQNGKIIILRERDTSLRIFINICIGLAWLILAIIFNEIIKYIYGKVKKME